MKTCINCGNKLELNIRKVISQETNGIVTYCGDCVHYRKVSLSELKEKWDEATRELEISDRALEKRILDKAKSDFINFEGHQDE